VPKQRLRYLLIKTLKTGDHFRPGPDEEARLLGARVNHIAATESTLALVQGPLSTGTVFFCYHCAPSSTCTDSFTIPPALPTTAKQDEEDVGAGKDVWFTHNLGIWFNGDATAAAHVIIEVVKIDPETGERLA